MEDYAARNGFGNIVHFTDDGISGTRFDRPGFMQMMNEVEAGNVGTVLIKDMSRLGRDYLRVGFYMEILRENGVRLIALGDNVDTAKGEDDFIPFRNIINEWAARDSSRKTRAVFKARALEGKHNSPTPPYGYLRDPGDKEKWIVDEEAAVIVRRIYQMVLNGMGPYQIAQALSDEKVPIPSYHWQKLGVGNRKNQALPYPYTWGASVIRCILEKEEYMGHTVTMKTFTHSYKDKKRKLTPKDQRLIFENTHEAIIDPDTWNTVQRLSRTVRRPTWYGPPNRLTGHLYCADCGKKMTNERTMVSTKKNEPRNNYGCSTFRYRGHHCTMHFIQAAAAEELILHTIRTVSAFVRENEEEFVRRVRDLSDVRREESMKERRMQLAKSERRCAELDTLIRKIYEDKVCGALSEKRFAILSGEYEREQDALETTIAEAQAELDA